MISSNCKKSDHDNCSVDLNNSEKCECGCHRSNSITQKLLQEEEEKDKHGITRQDELMAETLP